MSRRFTEAKADVNRRLKAVCELNPALIFEKAWVKVQALIPILFFKF